MLLNTSTAHNVRFDFMTKIYMAPEIRGLDIERFESGIERNIVSCLKNRSIFIRAYPSLL